jgi:putative ATP-binding cassette transporter
LKKSLRKRVRSFDQQLWNRFWRITRPYWFEQEKGAARGLLLLLIVLLLGRTEFTVLINQQTGEFTSALAAKDASRFWHSMQVFGVAIVAAVPVYGFYYFVRDRLGVAWRRWLTQDFLERYLANRAFYRLTTDDTIDNPDQRIAEDVRSFTQRSLFFLLEVVSAVLQLVAFSSILWAISKTLVGFLVVYAIVGTSVTFLVFGKPLIGLNFQQLRREADFRFGLIRLRENAEAVAFYRGEGREGEQIRSRFGSLYNNYKRLLRRTLGLNLFQYGYSFVTLALPSIIIAPRILSGELEVGRAVQAGGAFAAMLSALTVFVDNFENLSAFAAGIERLNSFSRSLRTDPPAGVSVATIQRSVGDVVELDHVTLKPPVGERVLVSELSVRLSHGQGLALVGPSGGGKSSLLRAIAGLWNSGTGTIVHPELEQMLFLPQRPYMVLGTLREQLLYPNGARAVSDDELQAVLKRVNLPELVERCGGWNAEMDFTRILSVGEQQRLAIARALLSSAKYMVLDEATSALDQDNEARLYRELRERGAALISVTHHASLLEYHEQVLELTGDSHWHLRNTKNYTLPPSLTEVETGASGAGTRRESA